MMQGRGEGLALFSESFLPVLSTGNASAFLYIQLYSPHNMVAQANKTSKNTTNEI